MKFNKIDLYSAVEKGDVKKTKNILSQGLQVDNKTGEWSLFLAIKNNNLHAAELLQQKGAKIRNEGILKAKTLFLGNNNSEHDKDNFKSNLKETFPQINE